MYDHIWQFNIRRGHSDDPRNGACLLDAVSWLEYGTLGDHPECVCPVLAAFGRGINDAMSDEGRQQLKKYIPLLVGTVDKESEQARAEYLAWQAVRVFAPLALRKVGLYKEAERLEGCKTLRADAKAAWAAEAAARAAAEAAAWAARAAAEPLMIQAFEGALAIGKQSPYIDELRLVAANHTFLEACNANPS